MITITLSIGSAIIGYLIGTSFAFFALWLSEREMTKDDRWHVGFSKGWDCGYEFRKTRKKDEEN